MAIQATPSVPVVVATAGHLNKKAFYQGLTAGGTFLLALNLWLQGNPDMVTLAAHKWVWVGPAVSFLARACEAWQTYSQKQKTQQVNNTTPDVTGDTP